jgi:hypothetical protein
MAEDQSPEQRKFEEFYLPEDFYSDEEVEDEEAPCDYGMDTECVEPSLRNMGNCFECWLYREMLESET